MELQENSFIDGGTQNGTAILEDSLTFLSKLSILLPYNPEIILLGIDLKELENLYPHKSLHVDVYSGFIHNCQYLEATKMSIDRWMEK